MSKNCDCYNWTECDTAVCPSDQLADEPHINVGVTNDAAVHTDSMQRRIKKSLSTLSSNRFDVSIVFYHMLVHRRHTILFIHLLGYYCLTAVKERTKKMPLHEVIGLGHHGLIGPPMCNTGSYSAMPRHQNCFQNLSTSSHQVAYNCSSWLSSNTASFNTVNDSPQPFDHQWRPASTSDPHATRPPYSYISMIAMAIENSPNYR